MSEGERDGAKEKTRKLTVLQASGSFRSTGRRENEALSNRLHVSSGSLRMVVLDRSSHHNSVGRSHQTVLYHPAATRGVSRAGGKGESGGEGCAVILMLMGGAYTRTCNMVEHTHIP